MAPIYDHWEVVPTRLLPRPLVFTNGVFDLLHDGHRACLAWARALGASLVVAVNRDESVRRLGKGPDRPVEPDKVRARAVASWPSVSAVILFDEDSPVHMIQALQPEIYVKGGDYVHRPLPERELLAQWGGQTVIVPRLGGHSTTALVEKMKWVRTL